MKKGFHKKSKMNHCQLILKNRKKLDKGKLVQELRRLQGIKKSLINSKPAIERSNLIKCL